VAGEPALRRPASRRLLRIPAYDEKHVLDLARVRDSGELSPELAAMREQLLRNNVEPTLVSQMLAGAAAAGGGNAWPRYAAELAALRDTLPHHEWAGDRSLVEYLFVRDEPSCGAISSPRSSRRPRRERISRTPHGCKLTNLWREAWASLTSAWCRHFPRSSRVRLHTLLRLATGFRWREAAGGGSATLRPYPSRASNKIRSTWRGIKRRPCCTTSTRASRRIPPSERLHRGTVGERHGPAAAPRNPSVKHR